MVGIYDCKWECWLSVWGKLSECWELLLVEIADRGLHEVLTTETGIRSNVDKWYTCWGVKDWLENDDDSLEWKIEYVK